MKPVTSLLIGRLQSVGNPLVRNSSEFLDTYRQCNVRLLGRADHHYISQGSVSLAQCLQMAVLRFSSLENRLASLNPFHGGCGSQEDFLSLEAAGACVEDYSSGSISIGRPDGSSIGAYRCN